MEFKTTKKFANYLLEGSEAKMEVEVEEKEEFELDEKSIEKAYTKLEKIVAGLDEETAEKFASVLADLKKGLGKEEDEEKEEKEDKE
jgi:hypothetical protein